VQSLRIVESFFDFRPPRGVQAESKPVSRGTNTYVHAESYMHWCRLIVAPVFAVATTFKKTNIGYPSWLSMGTFISAHPAFLVVLFRAREGRKQGRWIGWTRLNSKGSRTLTSERAEE
jgi:hypothetical protein